MNLQIVFGSCGGFRDCLGGMEIDLEDVDVDSLLEDIGIEYVMEYFDLVQPKEDYGVSNEDF
jgi:hypothetical protein